MEKNLALKLFATLRKSAKGEPLTDAGASSRGCPRWTSTSPPSSWRRKACLGSTARTRSLKTSLCGLFDMRRFLLPVEVRQRVCFWVWLDPPRLADDVARRRNQVAAAIGRLGISVGDISAE
jgi:hypothetical protein